jgi:uncharacterized protein
MIVGVAVVELHVHGSQSLKAKRGVVRSITSRLRNRFNISVNEVGGQDTWQRAVIGISMMATEEAPLRRNLARAIRFVEDTHLAQVLRSEIEILPLPLAEGLLEAGETFETAEDLPWSLDSDTDTETAGFEGGDADEE